MKTPTTTTATATTTTNDRDDAENDDESEDDNADSGDGDNNDAGDRPRRRAHTKCERTGPIRPRHHHHHHKSARGRPPSGSYFLRTNGPPACPTRVTHLWTVRQADRYQHRCLERAARGVFAHGESGSNFANKTLLDSCQHSSFQHVTPDMGQRLTAPWLTEDTYQGNR